MEVKFFIGFMKRHLYTRILRNASIRVISSSFPTGLEYIPVRKSPFKPVYLVL